MTWRATQLAALREALAASAEGAGVVYLLHFDRPIVGTQQHYTGWTRDLEKRLAQHAAGDGARFTRIAARQGIEFTVAVTFAPASQRVERALKALTMAACPLCGEGPPGLAVS